MKLSLLCLNLSNSFYSCTEKYMRGLEVLFAHPPKCSFEVILVDNGSTDDSVERFQQRWGDRITIISLPENVGFQKGTNIAASHATGEYICTLNPDVEVHDGMFDTLISYMESHPDVGLVGPQLLNPDGSIQDSYRRFMRPLDFIIKRIRPLHKIPYFKERMISYLMWKQDMSMTQEVDWILGACIMMRRAQFEEVGRLDERFFLFNGDTDLCKKVWQKGWKVVYVTEAKAQHGDERASGNGFFKALFKKTAWMHLRDMITYFRKWGI